jgi:ketosteroid isomerase-like protein
LELVQSMFADWERGGSYFGSAEWADPDIEFVLADGPDPGSWTGITAMAEAWGARLDAWKDFGVEVEEYRELDAERVLVFSHVIAHGKTSGVALGERETRGASVLHLREGKITRFVLYFSAERALGDLGLPSESDAAHS